MSVSVTFYPDMMAIRSLGMPGGMVYEYYDGKAGEVHSIAQFLAPVDTGALRDSIYKRTVVDGSDIGFEIGTDLDYGLYQEVGTIHHGPQPFLRPALEAVMGGS